MTQDTHAVFGADWLRAIVEAIFRAAGSSQREADLIARHLVEANLRGHHSHGVGAVPAYIRNVLDANVGAQPGTRRRSRQRQPAGVRREVRGRPGHGA